MPYMLNPGQLNWGGLTGFFWGELSGLLSNPHP